MKTWTINYNQDDSGSGWVFEWFATKKEATARYNALNADLEGEKVSNLDQPAIIDVPTHSKKEMLAFLNTYAVNGMSS